MRMLMSAVFATMSSLPVRGMEIGVLQVSGLAQLQLALDNPGKEIASSGMFGHSYHYCASFAEKAGLKREHTSIGSSFARVNQPRNDEMRLNIDNAKKWVENKKKELGIVPINLDDESLSPTAPAEATIPLLKGLCHANETAARSALITVAEKHPDFPVKNRELLVQAIDGFAARLKERSGMGKDGIDSAMYGAIQNAPRELGDDVLKTAFAAYQRVIQS